MTRAPLADPQRCHDPLSVPRGMLIGGVLGGLVWLAFLAWWFS
jgi:hypothetical protein